MPNITLHDNDLPGNISFGGVVGIDCEMMGLNLHRDRLCVLQIYDVAADHVHIVQFKDGRYAAPAVRNFLQDPERLFIGHMIRLDMGWLLKYLGVMPAHVYCTRTASRLARTFTNGHDFKELVHTLLGKSISKAETSSDWSAPDLTPAQIEYACNDVIFLHQMKEKLDDALVREGRDLLFSDIMKTLPARVRMDVSGWWGDDILSFPF